jgi:DNA polymerase III alpha subunit (gram-positive type)
MKNAHYIVFDCETGGLEPMKNPITQIALLTVDGDSLKEINRWETFVKPYDDLEITKEALNTTGLKMADINAGLSKKDLVNSLITYFKESAPNSRPENRPVLVGHNVQFDMGFLNYIFNTLSKNVFDYVNPTQIDTMALTKMYGKTERLKLEIACAEFGIVLKNAHSAMPDVIATTDLLKQYVSMLRSSEKSSGSSAKDKVVKSRVKFQF